MSSNNPETLRRRTPQTDPATLWKLIVLLRKCERVWPTHYMFHNDTIYEGVSS
jgi:hypothetical protein